MVVGFISISPSDIVQNSRGNPPASHTPRFTASATWRRWALQLFSSLQELQMPITGFPSNTRSLKPSARSQARCASPQRSSFPNQSRLRSFVDRSLGGGFIEGSLTSWRSAAAGSVRHGLGHRVWPARTDLPAGAVCPDQSSRLRNKAVGYDDHSLAPQPECSFVFC